MVRTASRLACCLIALIALFPAIIFAAARPGLELRSLTAYPENDRYGAPVIQLNGDDPLVVSFDLLEPERCYLRFSLTHCDASWKPDALQPIEYVAGFNEGTVDDFAYSQGTLIPYVNYRLKIPGSGVSPTVSGNYILSIYEEGAPDDPLATFPFMITEDLAKIGSSVSGRTDFDYNNSMQQLEVEVDFGAADIRDPWNELKVIVTPNFRHEASQKVDRPMRVNGSKAIFAHNPGLTFKAGKEFRRFETVSTSRYLPMGVEWIAFDDPWYHFRLYTDTPQAGNDYRYDQTQFGRFTINADDTDDPDTQGEYVKVHFALDIPEQPEARIVISGELTGNRTDAASPGIMTFNRTTNQYEATLTLKQGSYNYQYLLVPDNGRALTAPIEGDDYRTANRYDIAVYYRGPTDRYDRLIGFSTIYSGI